MSVLHSYFDYECNQCSPISEDFERVVNVDDDGVEHITYEKVDYPSYQKSLGDFFVWSLQALLKAGINPDFPIHTGYGTRIEGINTIKDVEVFVDSFMSDASNN